MKHARRDNPTARRMRRSAPALAAVLVCVPAAPAQPWSTMPQPYRRVDPGIGDVGPLRLSLRELQLDLRQPTGFDTVYRIDAAPHLGGGGAMYMRMDGGVTAVFPQSVYRDGSAGPIAEIPPGTVFHLGGPPAELLAPEPARPRPPGYMDLSIDRRAAGPTDPWAGLPRRPLRERSIWNDDEYRRYRIERLLSGAAGAEREPGRE